MGKSIKTTENKGGNNKRGYARRSQGIHICTTHILKIYEDDATTCEFRIYLENLHCAQHNRIAHFIYRFMCVVILQAIQQSTPSTPKVNK